MDLDRLRTEKTGHTRTSNAKTTPFKRALFNVYGHVRCDVLSYMSASLTVLGFPDAEFGTTKCAFTTRIMGNMTLKEGALKSWTAFF